MSKFSVLIAHYNSADFFETCYRSIINQDYKDIEIIIVDDCSTDGSYEKVLEMAENSSVKIFRNEKNSGVGFTKRRCVELATGSFCGFVDPDDALQKNAIRKAVEAYRKYKDIVATYSKFYICDENLKVPKTFPNSRKVKTSSPYFFNILFEVSHFFTFKRAIYFQTSGIREDLKISEDMDFYLKMAEKGDFQFISEELYYYRVHKNGLSHDKENEKLKQESWDDVLRTAAKRRNISEIDGKKINEISNLPEFLFKRENTVVKRILRKI